MNIPRCIFPVLAMAWLALPLSGFAQKLDFSDLGGSYSATYDAVLGPSTTVKGKVDISIDVPGSGRKAVMEVTGYGKVPSLGGLSIALLGRTTFKGSRRVASDNALVAFYVKLPGRSRLKGTIRSLRYKLSGEASSTEIVMSYVLKVTRRSISIVGKGTYAGDPATVTIKGRRTR